MRIRVRVRAHIYTHTQVALLPVYISVRPRGTQARAGQGVEWRGGWKREDGARARGRDEGTRVLYK